MKKRIKGSHLLSCLLTVAMIITCMSSMTFASTELTVSTTDHIAAAKDDPVKDQTNKSFTGQALVGEYGYYAKVKVEIDSDGMIASVNDNGTIPAADSQVFWNRIIENNLLSKYEGIPSSQVKSLENSIDSVTGATESSKAVFEAVCNAVYGESIDTDAFDVDDQGVLKEYTKDAEVVTIPEGVVEIDEYSFSAKEKIQKVIISSSVEYINTSAFLNCPNLSEFVINANNKSFYSRNGVIYRKDSDVFFLFPCGISGEFSIPDGVTEIGDGAFFSSALKTLKLSASVKTIGTGIIDFAENLDEIAVDEKNPCFSDYDGILFNKERSILILVPTGISGEHIIPDTVKEIGEGAFYSCSKLTKISLPEGLKEIPVLAFAGCVSLEEIVMPESLESIGDRAFAGCQAVRLFTVPENVSDFGNYVFANSVNLTEILVDEGNQNFTSVDGVLFSADKKTLVQYPLGRSGDYGVPEGTQRLDVGSFFSANLIEKVTVPESVTIFGNGGDTPLDSIVFGYPGGYPANLIISANKGSAAEKYADSMDIPFVELLSDQEIKDIHNYKDVDTSLWYFEGIDYALNNGLMKGIADDLFAPDETTTRAMIVTILYRLEGEPAAETSSFKDVKAGSWYEAAVNWAAANDIVNGYNADTFAPTDIITREQMATILYRYSRFKGKDVSQTADLINFTDAGSVSDWAKDAMAWAVEVKLINGMTDTTLVPQGNATRAQAATLMMRLCEEVIKEGFAGGSGTAENPWQIATAEQLNRVRDNLTAHYVLVDDIDLSSYENWIPIGTFRSRSDAPEDAEVPHPDYAFTGTFDGADHTISNLHISCESPMGAGLFGCTSGTQNGAAYIGHFTLKNVNVSGAYLVGGAIGLQFMNCPVSDIHLIGDNKLAGMQGIGGIVGTGFDLISDCSATAEITVLGDDGACAGVIAGGTTMSSIKNCEVLGGKITAEGNETWGFGALCGAPWGAAEIMDCKVSGTEITVSGENNRLVGGLVGFGGTYDPASPAQIAGCTVEDVTINVSSTTDSAGGLIGGGKEMMEGSDVMSSFIVSDCTVSGRITGGRNSVGAIVGDPACAVSVDCEGGMIIIS